MMAKLNLPCWTEGHHKVLSPTGYVFSALEVVLGDDPGSWSQNPKAHYLLRRTGLFCEDVLRPDCQVSPNQVARLLDNLRKEDPTLSFAIAQRLLPGVLETSSNLLMHAPTLGHALEAICLLWWCHFPLLAPRIRRTDNACFIVLDDAYGVAQSNTDLYVFLVETVFSALMTFLNWSFQQPLPWQASFSYNKPSWHRFYFGNTDIDVRYHQPITYLAISQKNMGLSRSMASTSAFAMAERSLEGQTKHDSLILLMKAKMRASLIEVPKLEAFADELGVSTATLKRKLKQHKTSYQMLWNQVRWEESYFLKRHHRLSDDEIAGQLSFYDVSNFRRFLRRWERSRLIG